MPTIQEALENQPVNDPNAVFENLPPQLGHNQVLALFKNFKYNSGRTILNSGLLTTFNNRGLLIPYREINKNGSFYNHEMIIRMLRILTLIKAQRKEKENCVINYKYITQSLRNVLQPYERFLLKEEVRKLILFSGLNFLDEQDIDETENVESITEEDLEQ